MVRRPRTCSAGFTLVELLVVISIISLMVALLMPALSTSRMVANTAVCGSNLRSIGQACYGYAGDFRGYAWGQQTTAFPPFFHGTAWTTTAMPQALQDAGFAGAQWFAPHYLSGLGYLPMPKADGVKPYLCPLIGNVGLGFPSRFYDNGASNPDIYGSYGFSMLPMQHSYTSVTGKHNMFGAYRIDELESRHMIVGDGNVTEAATGDGYPSAYSYFNVSAVIDNIDFGTGDLLPYTPTTRARNGPFSMWGRDIWFGVLLPPGFNVDSNPFQEGDQAKFYHPNQSPNALHADGHVASHRAPHGWEAAHRGYNNTAYAALLTIDGTTFNW